MIAAQGGIFGWVAASPDLLAHLPTTTTIITEGVSTSMSVLPGGGSGGR